MKIWLWILALFSIMSTSAQAMLLDASSIASVDSSLSTSANVALRVINRAGTSNITSLSDYVTEGAWLYDPSAEGFRSGPPHMRPQVLELDFDAPIRVFTINSSSPTDVGLYFYIYDAQDNFVEKFYDMGTYSPPPSVLFREATLAFDYDVGKIVLGGADGPHSLLALSYSVPEPSAALMLALGMVGLIISRTKSFPTL